jgi:hypothetical protein
MYEGLPIEGFCGLCNRRQRVLLRQWFVCPICLNVVLSYPKSFAASQVIEEFWTGAVGPKFPGLRLVETDVVQLEPFVPGARNQVKKAAATTSLDFAVFDDVVGGGAPVFHVEMKAGPGAIDKMKEFQLDINDSNDVATVCNGTGLPAYIFHVQVREEYEPPTRHSVGVNLWWTDCFRLGEHLKSIKKRRGEEDKNAGYYSPHAFRPMGEFLQELQRRGYVELRRRLADTRLPTR